MTIKTSGRSAFLIAAGLLVCFTGLSKAAEDTASSPPKAETVGPPITLYHPSTGPASHAKKHAHRGPGAAAESSTSKAEAANDGDRSSAISSSVANANAQLASADTPTGDVKTMAARANEILQNAPDKSADVQPAAESEVVSADQLNDVDRALHEGTPPAPIFLMAAAEAPAVPAAPVMAASSNENSAWDQTSLIGKIFIGFGALLTMASAVRMFMA